MNSEQSDNPLNTSFGTHADVGAEHGATIVSRTGGVYRNSNTKTTLAKRTDYTQCRNRQRLVTAYLMAGLKQKDIADMTGYTQGTISQIANSDIIKSRLLEAHQNREDTIIQKQVEISALVPRAVELYKEIMENRALDPKHRLHAADAVCEHGIPKTMSVVSTNVAQNTIDEIKQRAIEAAREMGMLNPLEGGLSSEN